MEERLLLTISQAAERLGVGRSFLYETIRRGELGSLTLGRARRIPQSELLAYIERLQAEQAENTGAVR